MKLTVIGSGSRGNCYVFDNATDALVLEAGCRVQEVKKALGWSVSRLAGVAVTHRHNDHAAHTREFLDMGIRVLAPQDVFDAKGISGHPFAKPTGENKGYMLGDFKVFAFPVCHDVPCNGYVIEHHDMGRVLIITDTMMLEQTFPPMDHIMIEANYADDIVESRLLEGSISPSLKARLCGSHMEFGTAKNILRVNDLSRCKNIVLIHLSDGNSDEDRFVREIRELTGIPTLAARPNLTVNLSQTLY